MAAIVENYQRGILNNIARSQIKQNPEKPQIELAIAETEERRPQAVQVVLTQHTKDHFYNPYVQTPTDQEDLEKLMQPLNLEDFPISDWLGEGTATY